MVLQVEWSEEASGGLWPNHSFKAGIEVAVGEISHDFDPEAMKTPKNSKPMASM